VLTTLPEFPLNAFFYTFSLHPNNLLFEDKKTCNPIPIPIPMITMEFIWNAALIASTGSNAGVVVSSVLIEYSQVLAYAGLAIIFGFAGLTAYKLKREIKLQKLV